MDAPKMTANLFAALLDGVPRMTCNFDTYDGSVIPPITLLHEDAAIAALAAAVTADLVEAGKVLEGVTPGPWRADGEPWNQIVWSGADNRVCFMAHSNGLDDARDVATARFIAWCREGVPALLARIAAQEAQIGEQGRLVRDLTKRARDAEEQRDQNRDTAIEFETALAAERAKVAKLVALIEEARLMVNTKTLAGKLWDDNARAALTTENQTNG